ncbi:hypothetical protein J8I87_40240 [Paraburkholderia sp. LEh10]|nr:hypothetical protein [Paraburkholderia sp. LEh10]
MGAAARRLPTAQAIPCFRVQLTGLSSS